MKDILHDRSASHYRGIKYSPKHDKYIETKAAGGPGSRHYRNEVEEGQVARALVDGPQLSWQKRQVGHPSLEGHKNTATALQALENYRTDNGKGFKNLGHKESSR